MDKHAYTLVMGYWVCDDCGATAKQKNRVKHFANCKPGESKKWEEHYSRAVDEWDNSTEFDYTQDGEGDGIIPLY